MECAASACGRAGCGPCSGGADWQAYQRRFSERCLDPAGQYHDAGARCGYDVICIASARGGGKCALAATTPGCGDVAHAAGGKEAAGTEARAYARAGSASAGDRCCSRGLE